MRAKRKMCDPKTQLKKQDYVNSEGYPEFPHHWNAAWFNKAQCLKVICFPESDGQDWTARIGQPRFPPTNTQGGVGKK